MCVTTFLNKRKMKKTGEKKEVIVTTILTCFIVLLLLSNLSELSDRAIYPQRVGRNHGYIVGRVAELSQRRAGLVVNVVATVARAHGRAAGGLGLRALPDDP